jgi:hypothetical protein
MVGINGKRLKKAELRCWAALIGRIIMLLSLDAYKQQQFDQIAAKIMESQNSIVNLVQCQIFIMLHGSKIFHMAARFLLA